MDQPEPPELPRGIALAWGVAATPQRGPKREMSVERIVDAAVELADVDGLGAVSMAAVAAKLGFTPMSLYRYVSAKDDLLLLMQEEGTGVPSTSGATSAPGTTDAAATADGDVTTDGGPAASDASPAAVWSDVTDAAPQDSGIQDSVIQDDVVRDDPTSEGPTDPR